MTAWIGKRTAAISVEPDDRPVRCAASATPRAATAATISPTTIATQRWSTWADVALAERRQERAVHQRPVREDVPLRRGRHLRPEQQQGEDGQRAERGEQREPLAAAPAADARRVERPDEDVDEEPDERHRRGEVRRHRLAGVVEPDRLAAEPGLEADEDHDAERRPQEARAIAMVADRDERQGEDDEPDGGGHRPMDPLDPGLVVVERRDQLAVAERPVRAAHARSRSPGRSTPIVTSTSVIATLSIASLWNRVNELSQEVARRATRFGVDGPAILARAPSRPLPATLSAMTPRTRSDRACWPPSCSSPRPAASSPDAAATPPRAAPASQRAQPASCRRSISQRARRRARTGSSSRSSTRAARSPSAAPDRTATVAVQGPGGEAVAAPARRVHLGDRGRERRLRHPRRLPGRRSLDRDFTTSAPGAPEESIPFSFDVKDDARSSCRARRRRRSRRRRWPTSAATSRRSRPTQTPVPAFYETSVADALAAHKPFVLVFATPKFCQTADVRPDARQGQDRSRRPTRT